MWSPPCAGCAIRYKHPTPGGPSSLPSRSVAPPPPWQKQDGPRCLERRVPGGSGDQRNEPLKLLKDLKDGGKRRESPAKLYFYTFHLLGTLNTSLKIAQYLI